MKTIQKIIMLLLLISTFVISATLHTAGIYAPNKNIAVQISNQAADNQNWIGIYPRGSSNAWANVITWQWTRGKSSVNMGGLANGSYEARLFYNNSFNLEASSRFDVGDNAPSIRTTSAHYAPNEKVSVSITGTLTGDEDWVGIFRKDDDGSWGNVYAWNWVNNGTTELAKIKKQMPAGEYEVRLFFHNEYGIDATVRASHEFSVVGNQGAKKKLILHGHSGGWAPMMAPNLIRRANFINTLPFSGYTVVGNSYTNKVMKKNTTLTYNAVWNELKGLKGLYPNKSNFLTVWMYFPGDLWDDSAWNRVTNNFRIVAKVAKDLGFAGIVYDDEAYELDALKLINYDKDGWFDYRDSHKQGPKVAYKNPNHTFLAHTEKMTARFKAIMQGMVSAFPSIDVLFYHSPAEGHIGADNAGKNNRRLITGVGPEAGHELIGAMFLGLKRGLSNQASLHDMGEDYSYRKIEHFAHAYQWRKYTMASDATNDVVDATEHWRIPRIDRGTWSQEISEGFMVTNLSLSDPDPEFDTRNKVGLNDMKTTLERAIDKSDEYVVFYSASSTRDWEGNAGRGNAHLDWLQNPNGTRFSIDSNWLNMMRSVYNSRLK